MKSYRRNLVLLSRLFSWIGTLYFISAVGMCGMVVYALWVSNSLPIDRSIYLSPDTQMVLSFMAPENWPAIAVFAIALLSKGVVTSVLWQQVSHVTRYVAEQQFLKAPTILVLKRLIFISIFSFMVDVLFSISLSYLIQIATEIFNRVNLNQHSEASEIFGPQLLHITNWHDFIIPNFNNANSLFLALICFIAIDAIKATTAAENELQEIKQEHSLIV